jgi:hypothetical protein
MPGRDSSQRFISSAFDHDGGIERGYSSNIFVSDFCTSRQTCSVAAIFAIS